MKNYTLYIIYFVLWSCTGKIIQIEALCRQYFFHFIANSSGKLIPLTPKRRIYNTAFITIITVVVFCGSETLTKKENKGKKMNKINKWKGKE